jgi:hypothetical protein
MASGLWQGDVPDGEVVRIPYHLGQHKLLGHVKPRRTRSRFLEFCRTSLEVHSRR